MSKLSKVSILGDECELECYLPDDENINWNGWACPSFTKAQADKVVEYVNSFTEMDEVDKTVIQYNAELDRYEVIEANNGLEGDELEFYSGDYSEELGENLYPIGSGSWTWSEVI